MGPEESLILAVKVFYPVVVIFGLPANALTLYILIRRRMRPGEEKTTPGLYLIALAVADSLVLIFIVFIETVIHFVILDRQVSFGGFCPFLITLDYGAHNASIWIIVVYTVERFIGVYFPIWRYKVSNPKIAKLTIAGVYVFSFAFALPHFFSEGPTTVQDGNRTVYRCGYVEDLSAELRLALAWGQSILAYIIPYLVLIILNGLIIYKLRTMRKIGPGLVRKLSEITKVDTFIEPRAVTLDSPLCAILPKKSAETVAKGQTESDTKKEKAKDSDESSTDNGDKSREASSRVTTKAEIHPRPPSASPDDQDQVCSSNTDRTVTLAPVETTASPSATPDVNSSSSAGATPESRFLSPKISRGKSRRGSLSAKVLRDIPSRELPTRSKNKPIIILITISATFVLLWFPRLVIFLISRTNNVGRFDDFSWRVAMEVSSMLGLLNSAINVFLYAYADSRFRKDLVKILSCGKK